MKITEIVNEAMNPAQQAAIAIKLVMLAEQKIRNLKK